MFGNHFKLVSKKYSSLSPLLPSQTVLGHTTYYHFICYFFKIFFISQGKLCIFRSWKSEGCLKRYRILCLLSNKYITYACLAGQLYLKLIILKKRKKNRGGGEFLSKIPYLCRSCTLHPGLFNQGPSCFWVSPTPVDLGHLANRIYWLM